MFNQETFRKLRLRILPILILALALREFSLFRSGTYLGARIFFWCLMGALTSHWLMDQEDQRTFEQEREAERADPKHLFLFDPGFRYHPRHRTVIALCAIGMGLGTCFVGAQALEWGYLLWGAALCIGGSLLMFLF